MNFRILEVFLSVNSSLSFTESADALHMSVSAVSRAIARLEEDLGCTLFDRDRRGMRPTSAADRLRPFAESVLAEWSALRRSLNDVAALRGELRIYSSVTASRQLLSPLLRAFRAACPGVDVRLQTGDQADGLERVRRGSADVAMIARPADLPETIAFQPLTQSPLLLCLPGEETASDIEILSIWRKRGDELYRSLVRVPWILPERGVTRSITENWIRDTLAAPVEVYARVAGHEAIAAMVSLGLGVGVVPELVADTSDLATKLVLVEAPGLPALSIGLCARSGRMADPILSALMATASEQARLAARN